MIRKEIHGNELYLYNEKGFCFFKRWIDQSTSMVFNEVGHGTIPYKGSLVSVTDDGPNTPVKIQYHVKELAHLNK